MTETKIYVGLNDSDTMIQRYDTEKYVGILKKVCRNYHVPFSFSVQNGGYIHEDGRYTEENTLVMTLLNADSGVVDEIARDLCTFFHQESIMITESSVKMYFVNETL